MPPNTNQAAIPASAKYVYVSGMEEIIVHVDPAGQELVAAATGVAADVDAGVEGRVNVP